MVWEKCWFFDFNWLTYLTKRSSSVWLDLSILSSSTSSAWLYPTGYSITRLLPNSTSLSGLLSLAQSASCEVWTQWISY